MQKAKPRMKERKKQELELKLIHKNYIGTTILDNELPI